MNTIARHPFRTGLTNAAWTGSGNSDTFRCHYCGVAETVPKGQMAKNVRWITHWREGEKQFVTYACNNCAIEN
jgi:hypothetical protein